jgi:hypothetical protein
MSDFQRVSELYLPRSMEVIVSDTGAIDRVQMELTEKALTDESGCYGYFPDQLEADQDLPACVDFAAKFPHFSINNDRLDFSFLRLAVTPQLSLNGLHRDQNALSGLCVQEGESFELGRAWRALFNLGSLPRLLTISLQDYRSMETKFDESISSTIYAPDPRSLRTIVVRPRVNEAIQGLFFCASEVVHGGNDGYSGHFIASYGFQEYV